MSRQGFARLALSLLPLFAVTCLGQVEIVDYLNTWFADGDNLVSNPLQRTANDLDTLLTPPDGTTVSFWNVATGTFDRDAVYTQGSGWSQDLSWDTGEGALVHAPTGFWGTFVGTVLAPDGSWLNGNEADGLVPMPRPPVFSGPSGVYLLDLDWTLPSPVVPTCGELAEQLAQTTQLP